ncbi:MAG TPA: hypothetical protein VK893_11685 [Pyrinomonadaceae bacterium]|nr:hypothetical protein [Pyrinomonadaceae bacterium]
MKRFLAILFVTLWLSLAASAQEHTKRPPTAPARPTATPARAADPDAGGWVPFVSDSGRFTILVPSAPEETKETVQSEHGPYTTHLFITREPRYVYLIGWVDYDPSFNFNRQKELEANRDQFVKGVKATLISTQSLTIDGYPVIEFTADTAERTFHSRVYMVGRRPYQIVIGYPKGQSELAPIAKFFNSFKVSL